MRELRGWISVIADVGVPDFWDEVQRKRAAIPDAREREGLRTWAGRRTAALVTGAVAGILAVVLVAVALRTAPADRGRVSPTPALMTLTEMHVLLERLLSDLWVSEARLAELRGEIDAAQNELAFLQGNIGTKPTEAELAQVQEVLARIQRFTASAERSQAVVARLRLRVEQVRAQRRQLLPPPTDAAFPDVATVECDGDGTGGTHVSTPVVRTQADGVHIRVVNRFPNERVFLMVQPDGGWAIPASETREVVMPPRPPHEVELTCTFAYPRGSWERPTHPLWISGTAACPEPPFGPSRLPWLPEGTAVPSPEQLDEDPDSGYVWFKDPEQRFEGSYVVLKRSPWSPVRSLSGFPTVPVRGTAGHLVWIGDPGVGELSIVWREGATGAACAWYSLALSSAGMTAGQAESTIRQLAESLGEPTQETPCGAPEIHLDRRVARPGGRVSFVGECIPQDWDSGYGIFLLHDSPACELIAGGRDLHIEVRPDGAATGSFTIPDVGFCFQSTASSPRALPPGTYTLGLGCHACLLPETTLYIQGHGS